MASSALNRYLQYRSQDTLDLNLARENSIESFARVSLGCFQSRNGFIRILTNNERRRQVNEVFPFMAHPCQRRNVEL